MELLILPIQFIVYCLAWLFSVYMLFPKTIIIIALIIGFYWSFTG